MVTSSYFSKPAGQLPTLKPTELHVYPGHIMFEMGITQTELIGLIEAGKFPPPEGQDTVGSDASGYWWRFQTVAQAILDNLHGSPS
ncbi:hypothetical protein NE850_23140 [Paraburkholderia sp. USG1]|uniref:hypothetical protein n=1 Tax=Paraburkholderia sp. USG1 TaxID=2952268 RepID=UPI00285DBA49|nr:hypothetical protein [Paraburkholderia sp. USG1]MDR8399221.1 hypothetical protein [Paraburkholderia sp. USG1]